MATEQYTDWIPGEITPVHIGVYEKDDPTMDDRKFQYWNGRFWGGWGLNPQIALANKGKVSADQSSPWRGLTDGEEL